MASVARHRRRGQNGVFVPIFALMAITLFSVAGLGIDTGHAYMVQRDAQAAADASSLAGIDGLKFAQQSAVSYSGSAAACTFAPAVAAVIAASLDKMSVYEAVNGCSNSSTAHCVLSTTASQYDVVFYDNTSPSIGGSCTGGIWSTRIEVLSPPCVPAGGTPTPSCPQATAPHCASGTGAPFNCLQVIITVRTNNYVMGIIGQPQTVIEVPSTSYGL